MRNIDAKTVDGFGDEWTRFDQRAVSNEELEETFLQYFRLFPWDRLPRNAVGFDLGCGTGRWGKLVAPRVGRLHCIDPSDAALKVAKRNLADRSNCEFHLASVEDIPLPDASMDFGYSLGVLHHVPDTAAGIRSCVAKLKPGSPFLVYLYYRFDNRPFWFSILWKFADLVRRRVSKLPSKLRYQICDLIAATVYFPLARSAGLLEKVGTNVEHFPLAAYRCRSFYTMRTDALDRFGTRLEQRFTAEEIRRMMEDAHLEHVTFSDTPPYWCAIGFKK
jgi:SAM-dependent methyltransferase